MRMTIDKQWAIAAEKRVSELEALNAELLVALKAMQNWAAKFESMLEYESLKDEKQFGKEHQETWQLITRAESQQ